MAFSSWNLTVSFVLACRLHADLFFKESWSISQVDYRKLADSKGFMKNSLFWQADCPLEREFHQS